MNLEFQINIYLQSVHDIEPYHKWRQYYISAEDKKSQFYGTVHSEFTFSNKVYNYFIHPQWDSIGSQTLYVKNIYTDYDEGYAMIELIGEWNDCLNNDIMYLKRKLVDNLMAKGIYKYIILCDNVLEYHGSDDSYYEEWWDDVKEDDGLIVLINLREHILKEMESLRIQQYAHIGEHLNEINWRKAQPKLAIQEIELRVRQAQKQLI